MEDLLVAFALSILPIAELRGGIPYAIFHDVNPFLAYFICCAGNLLAFPIVYFFLTFFHKRFLAWTFYENIFEKLVARTRKKIDKDIEKWGFWGLMVFVMIPLPVTGAYTGSFAAWIFGFKRPQAFMAVSLGVLIAGVIVTAVVVTGAESFKFFTKHI